MSQNVEARRTGEIELRLAEKMRLVPVNVAAARPQDSVAAPSVSGRQHGEIQHPGVAHIDGPIVIVPDREALLPPARTPGILDPKSALVVTDDSEGVHAS